MTLDTLNVIHPIGSIYETLDTSFNPNVSWGGTWSHDNSGAVLVSRQTGTIFDSSGGSVVGSDTAVADLPSHTHTADASAPNNGSTTLFNIRGGGGDPGGWGNGTWTLASKGSGTAHENRMRSKYVQRWIRTA